jgi:hypothetical protein
MSDVEPDTVPGDFAAPPEVLSILGQPDPTYPAVVPPNTDDRLTASEASTADLQRRVSDLETGP